MILSTRQPSTQWALLNKVISIGVMRITQIKKRHPSEKKNFVCFVSKLSGIVHSDMLDTGLNVLEIVSSLRPEPGFPITLQSLSYHFSFLPTFQFLLTFLPCSDMDTQFALGIFLTRCLWIDYMIGLYSIIFKTHRIEVSIKAALGYTVCTRKLDMLNGGTPTGNKFISLHNKPIHLLPHSPHDTTPIIWWTLQLQTWKCETTLIEECLWILLSKRIYMINEITLVEKSDKSN